MTGVCGSCRLPHRPSARTARIARIRSLAVAIGTAIVIFWATQHGTCFAAGSPHARYSRHAVGPNAVLRATQIEEAVTTKADDDSVDKSAAAPGSATASSKEDEDAPPPSVLDKMADPTSGGVTFIWLAAGLVCWYVFVDISLGSRCTPSALNGFGEACTGSMGGVAEWLVQKANVKW
eukprot:CAMPEP_0117543668 /NCGR_PEP_ID=MMETSP0784-20121206/45178_1 /TAXON_ID=39447 /ORGANISM="" /LENGTH=177 /DNA_ID=CAMNT_0005340451 /DNA_START=62 /DNA_END=592 /DNA_ORIENTATION=+